MREPSSLVTRNEWKCGSGMWPSLAKRRPLGRQRRRNASPSKGFEGTWWMER